MRDDLERWGYTLDTTTRAMAMSLDGILAPPPQIDLPPPDDLDGDCGIYNVGTLEHARRRGLATALTAIQLHDARARGCETASLQATQTAERLYAGIGFRDLGRILEYIPPHGRALGGS